MSQQQEYLKQHLDDLEKKLWAWCRLLWGLKWTLPQLVEEAELEVQKEQVAVVEHMVQEAMVPANRSLAVVNTAVETDNMMLRDHCHEER